MRNSAKLDITKDIQSLTNFRRNSGKFLKQIKKSKRPIVLTVNGKAEAIVQDAEEYQRLLDIAARADVYEALRQSDDDIAHGHYRCARLARGDDRIGFASRSLTANLRLTFRRLTQQSTVRALRSVTVHTPAQRSPPGFARSSLVGLSDTRMAAVFSCAPATGKRRFIATILNWQRRAGRVRGLRRDSP